MNLFKAYDSLRRSELGRDEKGCKMDVDKRQKIHLIVFEKKYFFEKWTAILTLKRHFSWPKLNNQNYYYVDSDKMKFILFFKKQFSSTVD